MQYYMQLHIMLDKNWWHRDRLQGFNWQHQGRLQKMN